MLCTHKTTSSASLVLKFVLSSTTHFSTNSHPFLVGIVSELSKHQSAFLFDCCVVIARFVSLSCYSSAKTRIQLVKSYQINESFCSITRCALLRIVYHLIAVSTCFWCPELQVRPLSLPRYCFFEPEPEPEPAFESHFQFFQSHFPITFLYTILLY